MKKYYQYIPRNFGNEYSLISVENAEEEEKLQKWYTEEAPEQSRLNRVTLKEIQNLKKSEMETRKTDPSFSGYCDTEPQNLKEFLYPEI